MRQFLRTVCGGLVWLCAGLAQAGPGYYLLTPYATPGETALDLRYWTVKPEGRRATLWPELGLRHGVNSRWTTELFASGIGPTLGQQKLSSWNWQNNLMLTQGQQPYDLALHLQLIHTPGQGRALEWGPVWQTDWGVTQLNLNLMFERRWGRHDDTRVKLQWQALHRLDRGIRLGLQGFSELGDWRHGTATPSHRAGPVLRLGLWDPLELQAAYLWGKVFGARAAMFSAQVLVRF